MLESDTFLKVEKNSVQARVKKIPDQAKSGPLLNEKDQLKQITSELLLTGKIQSQEELRERLSEKGFHITQSKVSRLIHRLGALKTQNPLGELTYTLPEIPPPPALYSKVSDLIVAVKKNETMIVINTNYGAANIVARILEYHDVNREILGAIAGSDTIFIVPTSIKTLEKTYQEIKKLLNRKGPTE